MSEPETHYDLNDVKVGVHPSGQDPIARKTRMCSSKVRYPDKKSAQTFLNSFNRHARGRHGRPEGLRAYACPICHGWHTSKKKF